MKIPKLLVFSLFIVLLINLSIVDSTTSALGQKDVVLTNFVNNVDGTIAIGGNIPVNGPHYGFVLNSHINWWDVGRDSDGANEFVDFHLTPSINNWSNYHTLEVRARAHPCSALGSCAPVFAPIRIYLHDAQGSEGNNQGTSGYHYLGDFTANGTFDVDISDALNRNQVDDVFIRVHESFFAGYSWERVHLFHMKLKGTDGAATISGTIHGHTATIQTTDRLAGAVDSLTWNSKEFVNSTDHGRQFQWASTVGYGECYNPTEAGSAWDGVGNYSSSNLSTISSNENRLETKSQMAFWRFPGDMSNPPGCGNGGFSTILNGAPLSEHILEKSIEIGANGFDAILFNSKITVPANENISDPNNILGSYIVELALYTPSSTFTNYYKFNPSNSSLIYVPTSHNYNANIADSVILANNNGSYAIGIYGDSVHLYGIANRSSSGTNKLHCIFLHNYSPPTSSAKSFEQSCYVVIGTLDQVKNEIVEIYND